MRRSKQLVPKLASHGSHFTYLLYGKLVTSNIALGFFPQSQPGAADFSFNLKQGKPTWAESDVTWFHSIRDPDSLDPGPGAIDCMFGRIGNDFVVRFPDLIDFFIDASGREISAYSSPTISMEEIQALVLTQILPLCLSQSGTPVLHAGAIEVDGYALAFLGNQSHGKSTLSAAFVKAGYPLITDDSLPLICETATSNQISVVPSFPEIRLVEETLLTLFSPADFQEPQHVFAKVRATFPGVLAKKPLPLKTLYVLNVDADAITASTHTLSGSERFFALLGNSFRLDIANSKRAERETRFLWKIIEQVEIKRLCYPKQLETLPEVVSYIVKDAGATNDRD